MLILDEFVWPWLTGAWFAFSMRALAGWCRGRQGTGGACPVSAFVARREVMEVFTLGSHGRPWRQSAAAAAVEALRVIHDEGLVERSRSGSTCSSAGCNQEPGRESRPRRGLWPPRRSTRMCCAREFCAPAGERHARRKLQDVVRLAPPLVISSSDLDFALDRLIDVIHELESMKVRHLAA